MNGESPGAGLAGGCRVAFFSIPAWGHTVPTVPVVRALTSAGNTVRYYSFTEFQDLLESAGADFRPCDRFLPPPPKDLERKVGRDFSALIAMTADTTAAMDHEICGELQTFAPDVVVADSVCLWGKLFAKKLGIPLVCSTTTLAFNRSTARLLHRSPGELVRAAAGAGTIRRKLRLLRESGYPVKSILSLLENDNDTDTVVYTSRAFQPMADTFSSRYAFVGSTAQPGRRERGQRPLVYISLGTVLNRQPDFYRSCLEAFQDGAWDVLLSVGAGVDPTAWGTLPPHVQAQQRVDQLQVLCRATVFVTHCGMNSASEAIACGVPTVLFPQQSEEALVADRMEALGAGLRLRQTSPAAIRRAVEQAAGDPGLLRGTLALQESFRAAGGARAAAEKILQTTAAGKHGG